MAKTIHRLLSHYSSTKWEGGGEGGLFQISADMSNAYFTIAQQKFTRAYHFG